MRTLNDCYRLTETRREWLDGGVWSYCDEPSTTRPPGFYPLPLPSSFALQKCISNRCGIVTSYSVCPRPIDEEQEAYFEEAPIIEPEVVQYLTENSIPNAIPTPISVIPCYTATMAIGRPTKPYLMEQRPLKRWMTIPKPEHLYRDPLPYRKCWDEAPCSHLPAEKASSEKSAWRTLDKHSWRIVDERTWKC